VEVEVGADKAAAAPPAGALAETVLRVTSGRYLSVSEIKAELPREERAAFRQEYLDDLVRRGSLRFMAAVGPGESGDIECRRCGSRRRIAFSWCARCAIACPECPECRDMGRMRGCDALYTAAEPPAPPAFRQDTTLAATPAAPSGVTLVTPLQPELPFALSKAQAQAAGELAAASAARQSPVLVWAACGAGKTEVAFHAVARELESGGRVLVTAPRRDVVIDLYHRLEAAFPGCRIGGLWGGGRFLPAAGPSPQLIVATTHQAMRLSASFSLVILDECDAFPYNVTPMLQRTIARLSEGGVFIQMTATPALSTRRQVAASGRIIYIPARHHGHPLPVPSLHLDRSLASWPGGGVEAGAGGEVGRWGGRGGSSREGAAGDTGQVPKVLAEVIGETLAGGGRLLVFVPTRAMVAPVARSLQQNFNIEVAGVHSASPERDLVREKLRSRELALVVCTTIFERGLTFPGVDVAVLFADNEAVFDRATLVQIAGRPGRTTAFPEGRVYFIAARKSRSMLGAVEDIRYLNRLAGERKLLL